MSSPARPRRLARRLAGAAALLAAGALLAACGIPTSEVAQPLPRTGPNGVPQGLLEKPATSTTSTTLPSSSNAEPIAVYFFDATFSHLVGTNAEEPGPTTPEEALALLAYGPTAKDSALGYQTALSTSPQATPSVKVRPQTGIATVALDVSTEALFGSQAAQAYAQIVYTVTAPSFKVRGVVFTFAGVSAPAELPDGSLTTKPVTRADYAAYAPLAAGHSTSSTIPHRSSRSSQ